MDRLRHTYVLIELPYVTSLAVASVWWAVANDVTYGNFVRTNCFG